MKPWVHCKAAATRSSSSGPKCHRSGIGADWDTMWWSTDGRETEFGFTSQKQQLHSTEAHHQKPLAICSALGVQTHASTASELSRARDRKPKPSASAASLAALQQYLELQLPDLERNQAESKAKSHRSTWQRWTVPPPPTQVP